MIYTIDFTKTSAKVITKYKKSNLLLYKKLYQLLEDMALHPRTGIGHPEP
jgi:toxin YoeB